MADKEQRDVMMTSSCIDSCSADRIKQPPFDFILFFRKNEIEISAAKRLKSENNGPTL